MKLKSLDLENWCQHASLHIDFPDTALVRIQGPNNVGKSNLIRGIGRALAQGRSDYGDVSDIRNGTKQASIKLTAETAEGTPFILERIIKEKQSKVTLTATSLAKPITSSEEIEAQLSSWFGRLDTLLALFIASQGKISSLLKTGGKQRLVDFIEICGFKSFLQKQTALNKFIKAYPTVSDPNALLVDIQTKAQGLDNGLKDKRTLLLALPSKESLILDQATLQGERALRLQQQQDLDAKSRLLQAKTSVQLKPLPNLKDMERRLQLQDALIDEITCCLQYQTLHKQQNDKTVLVTALQACNVDATDYAGQIQSASEKLQADLNQKQEFERLEANLQEQRSALLLIGNQISDAKNLLTKLPYSTIWHNRSSQELQGLQTLRVQYTLQEDTATRLKLKIQELEAVPTPTPDILAACQASEAHLIELQQLQAHAHNAKDACPLCCQPWLSQAITARIADLTTKIEIHKQQVANSHNAQVTYSVWNKAQKELPQIKLQLEQVQQQATQLYNNFEVQLTNWNLPVSEVSYLPQIQTNYSAVHIALNPPTAQYAQLELHINQLQLTVTNNQEAKVATITRIKQANDHVRGLLQQQANAQSLKQEYSRLQHQITLLDAAIQQSSLNIKSPLPSTYTNDINYTETLSTAQTILKQLRGDFGLASEEWANRSEYSKQIETLKQEIEQLQELLATKAWTPEHEIKLCIISGQLQQYQQQEAEISILESQYLQAQQQIQGLLKQKSAFDIQTANIADLQAVSSFLAYDNGPQKFLQAFFQDTIHQTNMLITEMGLPVTLKLGDNLEIMVMDRNKRISSSLSLGGGYANLIGIAFRIALQKTVIPRVNTVILDEPSTHVDEQNMELLIPFFERLKDNLHTYGISQCILIDHHPAWRNSSIGIIQLQESRATPNSASEVA